MSFWAGVEERALIEALDACDRLAPRLLDLLGQHEHAAAVARTDWEGPHHDAFEERVQSVGQTLIDGEVWVLHLRHELLNAYLAAQAAARVEAEGPVTVAALRQ